MIYSIYPWKSHHPYNNLLTVFSLLDSLGYQYLDRGETEVDWEHLTAIIYNTDYCLYTNFYTRDDSKKDSSIIEITNSLMINKFNPVYISSEDFLENPIKYSYNTIDLCNLWDWCKDNEDLKEEFFKYIKINQI